MTLRIEKYAAARKREWDEFVARAKNGVFLFHRDYLEYHADRFEDHSLLVLDDEKLVALIPANRKGDEFASHGGLTFGGVLSDDRMRGGTMLAVFETLLAYLRENGFRKLVYKAIPHIYHRIPAEEDLYALFRFGARLYRRDLATSMTPGNAPGYTKGRKWGVKKGRNAGLTLGRSHDFADFMRIEEENLAARHGVRPVHTAEEIAMLAGRFPENIRLYTAHKDGALGAGVIIYDSGKVAHAQYIATTPAGREWFAPDALMDFLVQEEFKDKPVFDFGISTESAGTILNEGLCENKESYGGRGVVYDFYEIDL